MALNQQLFIELTVIGPDRQGIVAAVTGYVFRRGGNIEEVNQSVLKGTFYMTLKVSMRRDGFDQRTFESSLIAVGKKLGMEIRVRYEQGRKVRNMAVLVTKEGHVLEALLEAQKDGEIRVNIPLIVGTSRVLENVAKGYRIPFFSVEDADQERREERIIQLLEENDIDLVVLARYMKILSPRFVWKYAGRIVNIHPSLLPSFPGALAYVQAFERGVRIAGATAHFVTVDLDQGPIIWQEAFKVGPRETLEDVKKRGRKVEARTLVKAVSLFLEDKLETRWGKVSIND